jgi:hypothetical protein
LRGECRAGIGIGRQSICAARHTGHAGSAHRLLGSNLVAHQPDHRGGRTDQGQSRTLDRLGESGVFRQKAVTRMDRFRSGDLSREQQRPGIKVT